MEGEQKKERLQNRNLKPLGSGMLTPEEELAIRKKGKAAADVARKRNADIRAAVRAVANMNARGRTKSVDIEKMTSIEQLEECGAPMISQLVYSQFVCAANGDKESRDWICRMLGIDPVEEVQAGVTVTADPEAVDLAGGVRIHLIRGDKAADQAKAESETATPDGGEVDG